MSASLLLAQQGGQAERLAGARRGPAEHHRLIARDAAIGAIVVADGPEGAVAAGAHGALLLAHLDRRCIFGAMAN